MGSSIILIYINIINAVHIYSEKEFMSEEITGRWREQDDLLPWKSKGWVDGYNRENNKYALCWREYNNYNNPQREPFHEERLNRVLYKKSASTEEVTSDQEVEEETTCEEVEEGSQESSTQETTPDTAPPTGKSTTKMKERTTSATTDVSTKKTDKETLSKPKKSFKSLEKLILKPRPLKILWQPSNEFCDFRSAKRNQSLKCWSSEEEEVSSGNVTEVEERPTERSEESSERNTVPPLSAAPFGFNLRSLYQLMAPARRVISSSFFSRKDEKSAIKTGSAFSKDSLHHSNKTNFWHSKNERLNGANLNYIINRKKSKISGLVKNNFQKNTNSHKNKNSQNADSGTREVISYSDLDENLFPNYDYQESNDPNRMISSTTEDPSISLNEFTLLLEPAKSDSGLTIKESTQHTMPKNAVKFIN